MATAHGDLDSVVHVIDEDKSVPAGRRRVAELAEAILAPALHVMVCEARASVGPAGADFGNTVEVDDGHRSEPTPGRRAVAELTEGVRSPALHRAAE